jgi:hypothetical protein
VKRLDELYSWKQIRKLQTIHDFNRHNGFVPVAIYAPYGGHESCFGGVDDHYEWYGKKTPYFARRLWEAARIRLADKEAEALEFNVVEMSESFNTIQFKRPQLVRDYCDEFRKLMKQFADDGMVECYVGRLPPRNHPWNSGKWLKEVVILDDAEYKPFVSHSAEFDSSIPEYEKTVPLEWNAVEKYFVDLNESELAFLNGDDIINKRQGPMECELEKACKELDMGKAESLLKAGANPNIAAGDRWRKCLLAVIFSAVQEHDFDDSHMKKASDMIDLLLYHGYDIDYSPFDSCSALYESTYYEVPFLSWMIEKGASPNVISWISASEFPQTALQSICDDIHAYGEDLERLEKYALLEGAGGKYFRELVPDFYDD